MRIGTWNLAGRWSANHRRLLENEKCDIWLLTEVPREFDPSGGNLFRSTAMNKDKAWAGVWGDCTEAQSPSPHQAAATAERDGVLYCSCVLPWRAAGAWWPEEDKGDVAGMATAAIKRLGAGLSAAAGSIVWGGDWNHALREREYAGTHDGREAIGKLVTKLGLRVPTEHLAHAKPGLLSIDHIAVPTSWDIAGCRRVVAVADGRRLSDHDAYVVDCTIR